MCVVVEEVASRGDVAEGLALLYCVDVAIVVLIHVVCQPKAAIVVSVFQNCGFLTRAVESESLKVGKSLKIGKDRIKSEKSDLIFF